MCLVVAVVEIIMVHEGLCQVEKFEYVKCNIQYSMPEGQSLDKAKSTKSSLADYFLMDSHPFMVSPANLFGGF